VFLPLQPKSREALRLTMKQDLGMTPAYSNRGDTVAV
jgi:hypothetical protein